METKEEIEQHAMPCARLSPLWWEGWRFYRSLEFTCVKIAIKFLLRFSLAFTKLGNGLSSRLRGVNVRRDCLVTESILFLCLDHARPLCTTFLDCTLNINFSINTFFVYKLEDNIDHNECPSSSNSRTAMYSERANFWICGCHVREMFIHIHQKSQNRRGLLRDTVIGPGFEVKLCDKSFRFVQVRHVNLSQGIMVKLFLRSVVDNIVTKACCFPFLHTPVWMTFVFVSLNNRRCHDDHGSVLLPHHLPEMSHRGFERALARDVRPLRIWCCSVDVIRVDVVCSNNSVFVVKQLYTRMIKWKNIFVTIFGFVFGSLPFFTREKKKRFVLLQVLKLFPKATTAKHFVRFFAEFVHSSLNTCSTHTCCIERLFHGNHVATFLHHWVFLVVCDKSCKIRKVVTTTHVESVVLASHMHVSHSVLGFFDRQHEVARLALARTHKKTPVGAFFFEQTFTVFTPKLPVKPSFSCRICRKHWIFQFKKLAFCFL
eukprot:m.53852 g.53852  ORF g.53852 m.53852 type:complete len:486 (-) comp21829_c0_seq1:364-1821(-)